MTNVNDVGNVSPSDQSILLPMWGQQCGSATMCITSGIYAMRVEDKVTTVKCFWWIPFHLRPIVIDTR